MFKTYAVIWHPDAPTAWRTHASMHCGKVGKVCAEAGRRKRAVATKERARLEVNFMVGGCERWENNLNALGFK